VLLPPKGFACRNPVIDRLDKAGVCVLRTGSRHNPRIPGHQGGASRLAAQQVCARLPSRPHRACQPHHNILLYHVVLYVHGTPLSLSRSLARSLPLSLSPSLSGSLARSLARSLAPALSISANLHGNLWSGDPLPDSLSQLGFPDKAFQTSLALSLEPKLRP
jgi:hypothetical protein